MCVVRVHLSFKTFWNQGFTFASISPPFVCSSSHWLAERQTAWHHASKHHLPLTRTPCGFGCSDPGCRTSASGVLTYLLMLSRILKMSRPDRGDGNCLPWCPRGLYERPFGVLDSRWLTVFYYVLNSIWTAATVGNCCTLKGCNSYVPKQVRKIL